MPRGFEDPFGPSFLDDPFAPRRIPVARPGAQRPLPKRRVPSSPPRPPAERTARRLPVDPTIGEPPRLTDFDRPIPDAGRVERSLRDLDPSARRKLRAIAGGRQDERAPTHGGTVRHERPEPRHEQAPEPPAPEPEQRAQDVARAALARAEAKLSFDEELARAKHRFEREAEREVARQRRETIAPFLDVLDDMDRALAASDDTEDEMRKGVEMIRDRFLAKLRDQGVTPMVVDGQRFDPERHEAMSMVPVSDPSLDNTVVGVIRTGYALDGDVLRPAGVAVGRMG